MADIADRRNSGAINRKRRFREDDDQGHRNQRRRTEGRGPPPHIRLRNGLRAIAESPLRRWHEETRSLAAIVTDHAPDDARLRADYLDLTLQLALEQPLKTPFIAAVALAVNAKQPGIVTDLLAKAAKRVEEAVLVGEWREVKLLLKLLACMQGCLEDDGVFVVLEELFERAVNLQTASSEDSIGTELVKIILLTIPYVMAVAPSQLGQKAADLMDKTEIIASEPHALQALVDPYHPDPGQESDTANTSVLRLLQTQLQNEAANNWPLLCLPRPWKMPLSEVEFQEQLDSAEKHALPTIAIPATVVAGVRPLFPEFHFSVFSNPSVESVPPVTNIAASLIRDAFCDTINILDFNRHVVARFMIDLDCYFADDTFVKRATPFDRLRDVEPGRPTWKPEDVAVDTVFSQIFQLPTPEHKIVYYHAVLTEATRLAPAAVAPSLGRAIRFLYRATESLDLELSSRFIAWFSHHLSNFGFMWKWAEWTEDVFLSDLHPCKSFIIGALDREIRLSFAQRIRKTLPEQYHTLVGPEKDKEVPDCKFNDEATPFAAEGRQVIELLKRKAPETEILSVMDGIHEQAAARALDPVVASTDVFMTAVCCVGSKSLSHVLACIDRTRTRLLDLGAASDAALIQIVSAVTAYWHAHPGVALSIIEKLLNYAIVSPLSVVQWALTGPGSRRGASLAQAHIFEMVFNTVAKVTGRVRLVVTAETSATDANSETRGAEVTAMRSLFRTLEDALVEWASGTKDEMTESADGGDDSEAELERNVLVKRWGDRWLRVFRRRSAIEEAFLLEAEKRAAARGEGDAMAVESTAA